MLNNSAIEVEVSEKLKRDLRILSKRYRRIRSDVQPIVEQLQAGEMLGSQVPGVGYPIFKVRIKNSDIQKGKSGGYRLIYYLKTVEKIILITIYSKSDQADITADEIRSIIAEQENLSTYLNESP
jgi:mRNA-degrading endonuclease RelE of RelBE toxin-antitoxin system